MSFDPQAGGRADSPDYTAPLTGARAARPIGGGMGYHTQHPALAAGAAGAGAGFAAQGMSTKRRLRCGGGVRRGSALAAAAAAAVPNSTEAARSACRCCAPPG